MRVFCPGRARTKGSLKPTHIRLGGGRCKVGLREDGEFSVPWKTTMIKAIRAACECAQYAGPVEVHSFSRFERPDGTTTPWPVQHSIGDEDKLRRNLLDALTQSALLKDDAQVVGGQNWKRWCELGEPAGILFVVRQALDPAHLVGYERSWT